jgi:hypothetical protein
MLGLPKDNVGLDLIKDLQEFAKEPPERRSIGLSVMKEDKTGQSKESGKGTEDKQP